jgi:hypothetical protein
LRQQLAVFKQKRSRPRLRPAERMFWMFLRNRPAEPCGARGAAGSCTG